MKRVLKAFGTLLLALTATSVVAGECIDYSDYSYWIAAVPVPGGVTAIALDESRNLVHFTLGFEPSSIGAVGTADITGPQIAGPPRHPLDCRQSAIDCSGERRSLDRNGIFGARGGGYPRS